MINIIVIFSKSVLLFTSCVKCTRNSLLEAWLRNKKAHIWPTVVLKRSGMHNIAYMSGNNEKFAC